MSKDAQAFEKSGRETKKAKALENAREQLSAGFAAVSNQQSSLAHSQLKDHQTESSPATVTPCTC